jgi:hypothetical protein
MGQLLHAMILAMYRSLSASPLTFAAFSKRALP